MQPTRGGGTGEGGGASQTGLSRFRSAPATWLEALLEDEEEDPLKPSQCLTQLLTAQNFARNDNHNDPNDNDSNNNSADNVFAASSSSCSADLGFQVAFPRKNSLPADFLDGGASAHDGLFSAYDIGSPSSFDLPPPLNLDAASAKRSRDLLSTVKLEQGGGLIDMEMDKLLEDSVAWRVRAKRGCATHPRSIAERVRRTRISDRIRKLQELVPNMDKQTNTADMLEEAVEYVKQLQSQIEGSYGSDCGPVDTV